METGRFEVLETKFIRDNIKEFDCFINVGANMGYYALIALSEKLKVIAFEPDQLNARILMNNIVANELDSEFEFHPIALSSSSGLLPIYGANTAASLVKGWAGQMNFKYVPVNTLDNIIGSRFDNCKIFVLIDIEGAECDCLQGAKHLLTVSAPILFFIEICLGEHHPSGKITQNNINTFKIFFDAGYNAFRVDNTFKEVTMDDVNSIQKTGINNFGTHNFIFTNQHVDLKTIKMFSTK
jgi:FkbM family methyltransferase